MADRLIFVRPNPAATLCARLARPAAWCCLLVLAGGLVLAQEAPAIHEPSAANFLPPPAVAASPEQARELEAMLDKGMQALAAKHYDVARHWLWIAAEQGNAESQFQLASIYRRGLGVESDAGAAAEWLRQSALQGHARAQNGLAEMFRDGLGVENDDIEAVWWFRRAAEGGQADARASLGELTLIGRGVGQDESAAVEWLRLAAEQQHATAQYLLGVCYAEGRGTVADSVIARRWLERSAALGHGPAGDYLKAIDAQDAMPPDGPASTSEAPVHRSPRE